MIKEITPKYLDKFTSYKGGLKILRKYLVAETAYAIVTVLLILLIIL